MDRTVRGRRAVRPKEPFLKLVGRPRLGSSGANSLAIAPVSLSDRSHASGRRRPRSDLAIGGLPFDSAETVVLGQSCVEVLEPNDAPEVAASLIAPGCTTGQLPEGDLADHLLWTLPAEATAGAGGSRCRASRCARGRARTVPVTSEPGAAAMTFGMPVADLRPSADAAEPSVTPDLLLAPGRYLIAVTPSGPWTGEPTGYRIDIEPGTPLPASGDREPNDDPTTATAVAEAFELSGDAAGSVDHFAWDVSGTRRGCGRWRPRDRSARPWLAVTDAAGTVLGEAFLEADGTVRLPDLAVGPGTYGFRVSGPTDGSAPYILRATQEDSTSRTPSRTTMQPARSNRSWHADSRPAGPAWRHGRLSAQRGRRARSALFDVRLITQSGPPRRLCLLRLPGLEAPDELPRELTCADGEGIATLTGLLLEPGDYLSWYRAIRAFLIRTTCGSTAPAARGPASSSSPTTRRRWPRPWLADRR